MPRVTIAIPTFNRAELLGQAIESVLAQSFGDFRLVVADNASTDNTREVVARYDDPRVEYLRRPENVGLLRNFDECLRAFDTEHALLLSDDDLLSPSFLAETVPMLDAHPRVGMVHTAFRLIDLAGQTLEEKADWTYKLLEDTVETGADFLAESMRWGCRICSSAALMRVEAIPSGFEQGDFPAIDFGLWLRMSVDWDIAFVSRPLAAYRIHAESQSAGMGVPHEAGYRTGIEWIEKREDVKLRFLDDHGARVKNVPALRRAARKARRYELTIMVRKATLPERGRLATIRGLAQALRADPYVAIEPFAWKLLAGSLLGPRLVGRLRGQRLQRSGA